MLNFRWSSGLWGLLGGLLIHSVASAHGHCWDSRWCWDMGTEAEVTECLRACRTKLSDVSPVYPGNSHMRPFSETIHKYITSRFRRNQFGKSSSNGSASRPKRGDLLSGRESWGGSDLASAERQEGKRSFSMQHFRWGRPVGLKKRPVKIYLTPTEKNKEESSESFPKEVIEGQEELPVPDDQLPEELPSEEVIEGQEELPVPDDQLPVELPSKRKRDLAFMTSEHSRMP